MPGLQRIHVQANTETGDNDAVIFQGGKGSMRARIQSNSQIIQLGNGYELEITGAYYILRDRYKTERIFDLQGRMVNIRDRNLNAYTIAYIDANGDGKAYEVSKVTNPTDQYMTYTYQDNWLHSIKGFDNHYIYYEHDAEGHIISITEPHPTNLNEIGPVTKFEYKRFLSAWRNLFESITRRKDTRRLGA